MSAPALLEHAKYPAWLDRPLTGKPDGSDTADEVADNADVLNLGVEMAETPTEMDDNALNGLGALSTALSQYRQSAADYVVTKVAEAFAAGMVDYGLGNVPVLGRFMTANLQPILDQQLRRRTGGKFSIADLMTGPIRVGAAAGEDAATGRTKAVSRLKARADMGNTSLVVAALLRWLRGGSRDEE